MNRAVFRDRFRKNHKCTKWKTIHRTQKRDVTLLFISSAWCRSENIHVFISEIVHQQKKDQRFYAEQRRLLSNKLSHFAQQPTRNKFILAEHVFLDVDSPSSDIRRSKQKMLVHSTLDEDILA